MSGYEPDQGFHVALTRLDLRQVALIITIDVQAAQWASDHGYLVAKAHRRYTTIYEIHPGRAP